ncbi:MAG: hypothetical protein KF767_03145 [Bdellovibrionaceae bacterium]|nr:hypothetical protein [Pseudobdellovibrionaceae bacterium]
MKSNLNGLKNSLTRALKIIDAGIENEITSSMAQAINCELSASCLSMVSVRDDIVRSHRIIAVTKSRMKSERLVFVDNVKTKVGRFATRFENVCYMRSRVERIPPEDRIANFEIRFCKSTNIYIVKVETTKFGSCSVRIPKYDKYGVRRVFERLKISWKQTHESAFTGVAELSEFFIGENLLPTAKVIEISSANPKSGERTN